MNVVHLFPYSPRISGGHANAIRSFINCQRAKGINALGFAPFGPERTEQKFEFPLAEVPALWPLRWASISAQFGLAPSETIVNFHSITLRLLPLMRDLRRAGVPYVLTGHGQLSFQTPPRWLKKFVYLNGVNLGPRRAAGLHVLTHIVGARMKFLLPGYAGRILVQGNLVAPPDFAALPAATKGDFGLAPGAFILLYLGRLDVWVKGLDCLVEAVSRLPPSPLKLVFVGPDWQGGKASLEKLANQLGCRDRLHFVDPVYGDKKWALLRLADIFVSPSRKEAFSVAVAEAMSAALPVITSTAINLAPELREHDAALLVRPAREPLAKAIAALQADKQLRQGLGARAKTWAAGNCHPDRAGTRFLEFYRSILDKKPH